MMMMSILGSALVRNIFLPGLLVLTLVGGLYMKGRIDSNHKKVVRTLKENVKELQEAAEKNKEVRQKDALRALDNQSKLTTLEQRIRELDEQLEDANRVCLSKRDTQRLRNLWK